MSLVCAGDNVVDVYQGTGGAYPGGNALNVSVAARRSGLASAYLGAVGDDAAGRRLIAALTAEAVATDRLRVLPGNTAWCGVQVVDGDRQFLDSDLGVSMFDLSADDLAYVAGFDALHTGDNSGLETQLSDIAEHTRVSFDFGSRPWSYVDELIDHVWCACFSGGHLTPEAAIALADQAAARGPTAVLVSEGSRGARLVISGVHVAVASQATSLTDSLGAGDALIGGVLSGLIRGHTPLDALTAGTALAAQAVTHYGAFGYGFDPAAAGLPPASERNGRLDAQL
jgi:fructoselysine 6-kinase